MSQFLDELVRRNSRGGKEAAQGLFRAVETFILQNPAIPYNCRVVARVYCDLLSLSREAWKAGLVDLNSQPRVLAPFAANFSSAYPSFDFVDLTGHDVVVQKMQHNFDLFCKDTQCAALLFGISSLPGPYIRTLENYSKYRSKIALIRTGQIGPDIQQLGLSNLQFTQVFRRTALAYALNGQPIALAPGLPKQEMPKKSGISMPMPKHIANNRKVRRTKQTIEKITTPISKASTVALPTNGYLDLIPINADGHRLDFAIEKPSAQAWKEFTTRIRDKKPCYVQHLGTGCHDIKCDHYHSPITAEELHCLKYNTIRYVCKYKGQCRRPSCYNGHVCQGDECIHGRSKNCWMPAYMHRVDHRIFDWVEPVSVKSETPSEHTLGPANREPKLWHASSEPVPAGTGMKSTDEAGVPLLIDLDD